MFGRPSYVQGAFPIESTRLVRLSPNPDDRRVNSKILGISAKVRENIAGGKLMSRSVRAADNKMAVMLDRNPLNSESFCRA